MNKKHKSIISALIIIAIILFLPFIVNAQDYGTGSIAMNFEFSNEEPSKFTVDSIKVNGFDWTSREDNYMVDTRELTVVLEVTPTSDAVPTISYCGGTCGNAFNVSMEKNGSKYTFTVVITNPEQNFTTFSLVEDEGAGGNPDEPGQPRMCRVTYEMNGGEPIDPVDFVCGNPAPPPSSEQIRNGDKKFAGWFANPALTEEYSFDAREDDNVTIYAKWEEESEPSSNPEAAEPTYHIVLDYNGAKDKEGRTRMETDSVGFVPFIITENFIDEAGVIPPEGQTLVAIKINGKIYEIDKGLGYELNKDTTFLYIWSGSEVSNEVEITSSTGFTVTFEGEEGEEYGLTAVDILALDKEDLEQMGVTEEEYNAVKKQIIEQVKGYGALLSVYTLEVDHRGTQYKGSVKIRVKMTEEMKKYNSFKFVYIDENNNFKVGDIVDVQIDGEYLVGTLPHLSVYAVVGENVEETKDNNPNTGDSVIINIVMLALSLIGLTSTIIYIKKHKLIRL